MKVDREICVCLLPFSALRGWNTLHHEARRHITATEWSRDSRLILYQLSLYTFDTYNYFFEQHRAASLTSMAVASSSKSPGTRSDLLRFSSHRHLRQRLLLSVLSGKSLRVDNIRSDDIHVGLRDYEVNLLRLIEKVTNGSTIEISVTGELRFSD